MSNRTGQILADRKSWRKLPSMRMLGHYQNGLPFYYMEFSWNRGIPKSSILMGFSFINQLFLGYPHLWKPPYVCIHCIHCPWMEHESTGCPGLSHLLIGGPPFFAMSNFVFFNITSDYRSSLWNHHNFWVHLEFLPFLSPSKWWFPEIGLPLVLIHRLGFSSQEPSHARLGYPHVPRWKPRISTSPAVRGVRCGNPWESGVGSPRRNSQLLGMPFAQLEFSLGLDELRELTPGGCMFRWGFPSENWGYPGLFIHIFRWDFHEKQAASGVTPILV